MEELRRKNGSESTESTCIDDHDDLSVVRTVTETTEDAEVTMVFEKLKHSEARTTGRPSSSKAKNKKNAQTTGDLRPAKVRVPSSKGLKSRVKVGAGRASFNHRSTDGSDAPAEVERITMEDHMLKQEAPSEESREQARTAAPKNEKKTATIGETDIGEAGLALSTCNASRGSLQETDENLSCAPLGPAAPNRKQRGRHRGRKHRSSASTCPSAGVSERTEHRPECDRHLDRRLSFVDMLSMRDIWNAIREEVPHMDCMAELWDVVLRAPYPAACNTLALRSLSNWVTVYNKWQALGGWRPGNAPEYLTARQASDILGIPSIRVVEFVQLFGDSESGLVQLPSKALMVVCVLMSHVVSKRQKVRFLLGLFDDHDQQYFDSSMFSKMMVALYHGIAAMFGLQVCEGLPSVERIQTFALCLYRRILNILEEQKGEMLHESTPLPFSVIEEWLMGHDDPLNLPLILFMARFGSADEEDPERFEDESQRFRLSHRHPVPLPLETAMSLESKTFLTRHEVIVVEKIFSHCASIGTYDISYEDAEKLLAGSLRLNLVDLWIERLHPALDCIQESKGVVTLSSLFKKLCPKATVRHLRMFHSWIQEYEEMEHLKKEILEVRQVLADFRLLREDDHSTESDPTVDRVISEFLELYLKRQEEQIVRTRKLFGTGSISVEIAPAARYLKAKVPEDIWRSWNEVLDLLDVHGAESEENLRSCQLLPPELGDLLVRLVSKDGLAFHRLRFLKMLCEVFNYRSFN